MVRHGPEFFEFVQPAADREDERFVAFVPATRFRQSRGGEFEAELRALDAFVERQRGTQNVGRGKRHGENELHQLALFPRPKKCYYTFGVSAS